MDAQDKDLRTPLVEAIINNHIEVARYLIQNGACVYHVVSVCTYFRPQCKTGVWPLLNSVYLSWVSRKRMDILVSIMQPNWET